MPAAPNLPPLPADTPEGRGALRLLLTRYSVSARHLREPGPSDEAIWAMAMAALRAPDHEKRIPFRFVVARGEGLDRLAALFVDYGRRHGKDGSELAREREKALQGPWSSPSSRASTPRTTWCPCTKQWTTVGGAIANAVNALHFMGFGREDGAAGGGRATRPSSPPTGRPGETLVGLDRRGHHGRARQGPRRDRPGRHPWQLLTVPGTCTGFMVPGTAA